MHHSDLDQETQDQLDAAAFRRLLAHLDARKDVQNIDLMILADFCRNCLGKWYHAAARDAGVDISDNDARERVYGMPYAQWKAEHQTPASDEQMAAFKARKTSP
ncbi:DUF1244 domain-containing protein [Maricaulis sp.]|uniref:DUF1244 domain-containing protein n=1 Tax=Maricaulis sp. TaxID=1486257 RepID=UPI0026376569|nr:DUF1244 domain-containing protein [Maricaulis sp.]